LGSTAVFHPEIQKISTMPYWLATVMAYIKGTKEMKSVSDFMASFEKIGERGDPSEANELLGAPRITLGVWLSQKKNYMLQNQAVNPVIPKFQTVNSR